MSYSVYINAYTIVSLRVASLRLIGGKKSNMGKCSCHRCTCKIQLFAMHTCKHIACTYSTTTYSYLQSVERAYIAAQAEIVDILHKKQHQRKNKREGKTTKTKNSDYSIC